MMDELQTILNGSGVSTGNVMVDPVAKKGQFYVSSVIM